jgi:phosphopantetheinyl transferase
MGRLSRQAGEARLIGPLWHDGPLAQLVAEAGRPVAWSVRLDSEAAGAALAAVRHTDRDLADFAAAPDAGNRLLRRRLARALLAAVTDTEAEGILFGRTAEGAASVLSPTGWYLSVAGRAPLALIGVARDPIGVDVEPLDASPPLWDMLAPGEAAELQGLPRHAQAPEWLRRWVAKEAHAKRLGYARSADPAAIATSRDGAEVAARSAQGVSRVFLREPGGRIEAGAVAA